MNKKQKDILEAASEIFMRYGVHRTTMSEIALAAKISRPTLYGYYTNKEKLLGGVIEFWNDQVIEKILKDMEDQGNLSGKLEIFFTHAVITAFDLMKSWPDASDILSGDNQVATDAYLKGLEKQAGLVEKILEPYAATITETGLTVSQYATFIVTTASKLKMTLSTRAQLEALLQSLKVSILCVADQRHG